MKYTQILAAVTLALAMGLFTSGAEAEDVSMFRATASSGQAVYTADINQATRATSTYSYQGFGVSYIFTPRDSPFFVNDATNHIGFSATKSGSMAEWNSAQNGWATNLPFSRDEVALFYALEIMDEDTKRTFGLGIDGVTLRLGIDIEDNSFGAGKLSLSSIGFSLGAGTIASFSEGKYGSAGVNFGFVEHYSTFTDQSGSQWSSDKTKFGGYLSASYSYSISKHIALSADAKYRYITRDYSNAASSFGSHETTKSRTLSLIGQF